MTQAYDDYSDLPTHVAEYLRQQDRKGSHGDRGKEAEGKVKKHLEDLNKKILPFLFEKLPDARAARGALKAVICDFLIQCRGITFYLEVKETQHPYRLSKDKVPQLTKLRKAELAGGVPMVLVWHSLQNKWRVAPISYFDGDTPASWDLRDLPLHASLDLALAHLPQWRAAVLV